MNKWILYVLRTVTVAFMLIGIFAVVRLAVQKAPTKPPAPKNCKDVVVKQVGGCDAHGVCGITLADGSSAIARYPVVGKTVKQCQ